MTTLLQPKQPAFFADIIFTIKIQNLIRFSDVLSGDEPELDNVVNAVSALYIAEYTVGDNTFVASHYVQPGLPYPTTSDGFIDYESLTEAQVIDWLKQQPSYAFFTHSLAMSIEEQMNAAEEPALPWA